MLIMIFYNFFWYSGEGIFDVLNLGFIIGIVVGVIVIVFVFILVYKVYKKLKDKIGKSYCVELLIWVVEFVY